MTRPSPKPRDDDALLASDLADELLPRVTEYAPRHSREAIVSTLGSNADNDRAAYRVQVRMRTRLNEIRREDAR